MYTFTQLFKLDLKGSSKAEIVPALFYALIRDGYMREALECLQQIEEHAPEVSITLYAHCATYLTKIIKNEYKSE